MTSSIDPQNVKNLCKDSLEMGINMIKNLYEIKKKKQHLTLNAISSRKSSLGLNSLSSKSAFESFLENKKKIHSQNDDKLFELSLSRPDDSSSFHLYKIKQTADSNRKELEKIHSILKTQLDSSKNLKVDKNNKNFIIHDKKCFEIYCLMNNEIFKKPINSNYANIKDKWQRYTSDFYTIFQSVKNWGEISNPIDIDGSSELPIVEMKNITFKEDWYSRPVENSAIESVYSGLAKIFNNMLEINPRFSSTLLKNYAPYQTDDYKAPKKIISKLFLGAAGAPKKKFVICNEKILISAKGMNEYDIELLSSDSDDEEDDHIYSAGAAKRKTKKNEDESSIKSKRSKVSNEIKNEATVSEAKFALNELNKTINATAKTSTEFFAQFNQLIDSLEHKSSLFFKDFEYPPLNVYSWHLEEMIGRCETIISTSTKNKVEIINIKNLFSNLLLRLINHKTKFPLRTPYFNSYDNIELISNWGEVFNEVDKHLATINNLKVIKLNMFDPTSSKVIDTPQNTFVINNDTKTMVYNVDKVSKQGFFKNLYKCEIDSLNHRIKRLDKLVSILSNLNLVLSNDTNFFKWFTSNEKLMSIKRKFYKFNAPQNTQIDYNVPHAPGLRQDLIADPYFDDIFNRKKTDNILLNLDKISLFNEAIRGYYSNPKINSYDFRNNNPTFVDGSQKQVELFAGTFYPGCYTKDCKIYNDNLVHMPNLGEELTNYAKIKLLVNVKGLKNISLPMLIIIQSIREQLNFKNNSFDLNEYETEIKKLKDQLSDINSLSDREFKIKFDIFAESNQTMQPIIAKSNIDRCLARNQDSITITKGSSGSGKTFTINGNGTDKKGFFEALSSIDPIKFEAQIELFEYYSLAMPFEESFKDSIDKQLTIPRFWRYDINSTNNMPTQVPVKTFLFSSNYPIQSFIKNYSRNDGSGIRKDIDEIRSNPNNLRDFQTIRATANNKVSSRAVFLQALKVKSLKDQSERNESYNIIIDRPGEEDPIETFNFNTIKIDNFTADEVQLALNNPIIGFLNKFNNGDSNLKQINWLNYFNAIGFLKLDKDMLFVEYLENFLKGTLRSRNDFQKISASPFNLHNTPKANVNTYLNEQFMNDLDEFASSNFTAIKSNIDNRFKELYGLDKEIVDYIRNIHKNKEWLDFEITCENFKEFNDSSKNLLFNGFKKEKIKIRDLFTMDRILNSLKAHNGNFSSKFLDLFGNDDFFYQIECPLLGHFNYLELMNLIEVAEVYSNFLAYFKNSPTNVIYFISQNYLNKISDLAIIDDDYQLSLDLYSSLCTYGNQSFLNMHTGITNFLMATAFYFSIFKNPNYIDYYDIKIKKYYDVILNKQFESVRGFFEAVSINEINNNQQTLSPSLNYIQPKQNISLNSLIFNSMKYYNDLVLPKFGIFDEYDRVASTVKHSVIDFTLKGSQDLTLRLNRLAVNLRHLDDKEIDYQKWNKKFNYIMTRVFNQDLKWFSVKHENFEKSSEYYIQDSPLLEVYVFNPFVESMPSGRKSCISIINSMM